MESIVASTVNIANLHLIRHRIVGNFQKVKLFKNISVNMILKRYFRNPPNNA